MSWICKIFILPTDTSLSKMNMRGMTVVKEVRRYHIYVFPKDKVLMIDISKEKMN